MGIYIKDVLSRLSYHSRQTEIHYLVFHDDWIKNYKLRKLNLLLYFFDEIIII